MLLDTLLYVGIGMMAVGAIYMMACGPFFDYVAKLIERHETTPSVASQQVEILPPVCAGQRSTTPSESASPIADMRTLSRTPLESVAVVPIPSHSFEGLAEHIRGNLRVLNPSEVHREIAEKGPIIGAIANKKALADDAKTVRRLTSAHEINMAAATQANDLLDQAIQLARKTQDLDLLPLEKQVKASALQASLAENLAMQADSAARARRCETDPTREKEVPEPADETAQADDPLDALIGKVMADLTNRGPVVRMQARKKIEAEARVRFKGDPDGLRAYMEAVDRALAEESRP